MRLRSQTDRQDLMEFVEILLQVEAQDLVDLLIGRPQLLERRLESALSSHSEQLACLPQNRREVAGIQVGLQPSELGLELTNQRRGVPGGGVAKLGILDRREHSLDCRGGAPQMAQFVLSEEISGKLSDQVSRSYT